jgi:zinc protease
VYILPVPTDSAGILEKSFAFLGRRRDGILFDSTEVVAERGSCSRNGAPDSAPASESARSSFPVLFQGSQYAERLPIGLPSIIEARTPGRCAASGATGIART